jgi:hypothetical protein
MLPAGIPISKLFRGRGKLKILDFFYKLLRQR